MQFNSRTGELKLLKAEAVTLAKAVDILDDAGRITGNGVIIAGAKAARQANIALGIDYPRTAGQEEAK